MMAGRARTQGMKTRGRFLGIPYRFGGRPEGWPKSEVWRPGEGPFPPKLWGAGWTINFAHPLGRWCTLGLVALGVLLAWLSW